MRFSNARYETEELTYEDVFLFQQYFAGESRFSDVNVVPKTLLKTSIPIVSANMNAVTGKRMAEAMARIGGLGVLPQDMELDIMREIIAEVRASHVKYDTPITVTAENTVRDAQGIIYKRSHGYVILVDDANRPIGIFNEKDLSNKDQFMKLGSIKRPILVMGNEDITDEEAFNKMEEYTVSSLPIVNSE